MLVEPVQHAPILLSALVWICIQKAFLIGKLIDDAPVNMYHICFFTKLSSD